MVSDRYQRNRECAGCLNVSPFLVRVAIRTPYGGCSIPLCFACRTGWVDDWKTAILESTFTHVGGRERRVQG